LIHFILDLLPHHQQKPFSNKHHQNRTRCSLYPKVVSVPSSPWVVVGDEQEAIGTTMPQLLDWQFGPF
jgi:hypothetical protein